MLGAQEKPILTPVPFASDKKLLAIGAIVGS
jgi:hypothetical protein